jgi:hypothetical protein
MVKINQMNPGIERSLCVLEVLTLQDRLGGYIACYLYMIWLIVNNSDVVFGLLLCSDVMRLILKLLVYVIVVYHLS